jgi:hypothetical protein
MFIYIQCEHLFVINKSIGSFATGYVGSIYTDIGWLWTFLIGSFSLVVGKLNLY